MISCTGKDSGCFVGEVYWQGGENGKKGKGKRGGEGVQGRGEEEDETFV